MQHTTNYNLNKPEGNNVVNVEDLNDNMDIVDQTLNTLSTGKAPKLHSSTTTEYGAATTSQYGHTKLYSGLDSDSESLAATPKAVKTVAASKADKVSGGTAGNIAVLTSGGGVADGGLKFSIVNGGLRITYDGE